MVDKALSRGDVALVFFIYITDLPKAKSQLALVVRNDIANKYAHNLILALISYRRPRKVYPSRFHIRIGTDLAEKASLD